MPPFDYLNKYDWLRLVLHVPFTPEQGNPDIDLDPKLLEARKWKGKCLGHQIDPGVVRVAPVAHQAMPKTEK